MVHVIFNAESVGYHEKKDEKRKWTPKGEYEERCIWIVKFYSIIWLGNIGR